MGLITVGNYVMPMMAGKLPLLYEAFRSPELRTIHTVYEGIKASEQIAFLGLLDKITKLDAGCGTGKDSASIPLTQKEWTPKKMKIWLQQCADDLEATFWVWGQNNGIARKDLTNTDFMDFIEQRVLEAIPNDAFRIAWFGDTAIAAGALTNGAPDVANYNQLNGFWKQIFAIVGTGNHRVTIAGNTPDGTPVLGEQDNLTALPADAAITIFDSLKYKAAIDTRLRGSAQAVILATSSLVNNYKRYLRSPGTFGSVAQAYERIEGGFGQMYFENTPIIEVPAWDRIIRSDFATGGSYSLPHRAVLTTKENLAIGVDGYSEMTDLKVYYDDDTELNNIKGGYKMDVKILLDHMIAAAY